MKLQNSWSLVGLAATAALTASLCFATPAAGSCSHFHGDPVPGYEGPMLVGIHCSYNEFGDSPEEKWTVPTGVRKADFNVSGADDPTGGRGGKVIATLAVTPGETLALALGSKGGASSVSRDGTPLLVAGGGNGAEPNYVIPGSDTSFVQAPGQPNPPYPQNGGIFVSWQEGWIGTGEGGGTDDRDDAGPHPVDCVVPGLRGKRPSAARKQLAKAHCHVGTVRRRFASLSNRGRVVRQWPKPGTVLPENGVVHLAIGRG